MGAGEDELGVGDSEVRQGPLQETFEFFSIGLGGGWS